MAIIDRIKYDGPQDGTQWLIYKHPSEKLVLGSQLIVNEGQEAVFFKGGKAADVFEPGTHTLSTGNLPILKTLVNIPFGGQTPFTAEIYYVNKTVAMDLNWGTSNPIPFEDPKYGLILNVGARGQYGMTIEDSRQFVTRVIGAMPNGKYADHLFVMRYFNGLINSKIKSAAAEFMNKQQISFLEITQYLDQLSEAFYEKIKPEFERFGMKLTNFYCVSIAPPKEEYEKLRQYKEELALGDKFYEKRRTLDIFEKLAENPGGSIAATGMGIGMGLGAVNQFGQMFGNTNQNTAANGAPSVMPNQNADNSVICPECGNKNNSNMKFCGNCGAGLITKMVCPHCGAELPAGMKFCGNCGKSLTSNKCPECGFENEPGMKFCRNCGGKL